MALRSKKAALTRILLLLAAAATSPAVPVEAAGAGLLGVPHWQPQWPWPQPDDPAEQIDAQWARTLEALWTTTHEHLGFCIGSSQRRAQARAAPGVHCALEPCLPRTARRSACKA